MAKKDADKCKYLAKYIYVKHSQEENQGEGQGKGESPCSIPVPPLSQQSLENQVL